MLDKYIDLVNSPTKESIQYDDSSMGTTIDTSMYSDSESDSQSDFYSNFMAKYRKKIKALMSSSPLDDDSSRLETYSASSLSESINYESNSTTFLYSKPYKNQSYQSPKLKTRYNHENNLNQTAFPSTHRYKTKINFKSSKIATNQKPKEIYESNKVNLPPQKQNHSRRHSERRRRRRKMKDFLTFDPVFNKYFYLKDKIESSDDYEYSQYSYYDDGYNDQESIDNQIQDNNDSISDLIDSNSIMQNESSGDTDLLWVETGKVTSRKPPKNPKTINIWEPSLASPALKKLSDESKKRKTHH